MSAVEVHTIETPSLGDRSYVVAGDGVAAVVDPQRDIDRVMDLVGRLGVRVSHVLETHIHNDYVTGGLELARVTGAEYCLAAAEAVDFDHRPVGPGETMELGPIQIRVEPTPGHTPDHISYVAGPAGGPDEALFSGGSLLYGAVGRTDLISPALTPELTAAQYRSARRLLAELAGEVVIYPTHGFGSFCASVAPVEDDGTSPGAGNDRRDIATERLASVVMAFDDVDAFVAHIIAGLGAYPAYYAHMGPANRRGPAPLDLSPAPPAEAAELVRRIERGEWVVDLRNRHAYAAGHLAGAIGIELGDSFATYLGWLIEWGTPVTLIGESPADVAAAQRMMARIGIDRPVAQATATVGPASYRVDDFTGLAAAQSRSEVAVLDVRRREEWDESHVAGATHVPLHELEDRIGDLSEAEWWVHCVSGYRASVACSLLDRAARRTVLIDDHWDHAPAAGIEIRRGAAGESRTD